MGNLRSSDDVTTHSQKLEITITNLGKTPQELTIQWFWVGRYASSGNWFRTADGEKTVAIDPTHYETFLTEDCIIEDHEIRKKKKKSSEHYKSGGNIRGWVIILLNKRHEMLGSKTSEAALEGFAAKPPPSKRQ